MKNVGLNNVNISNTGENTGGVTGVLVGGVVENCFVTGTVQGGHRTGGIVGRIAGNAILRNSYTNCIVTGNGYTGGITGAVFDTAAITRCYSMGTVTQTSTSLAGLIPDSGGITGYMNNSPTVNNCVALITLMRSYYNGNNRVGRILGYRNASTGTHVNNYARSDMEVYHSMVVLIGSIVSDKDQKEGESINSTEWESQLWWSGTVGFDFSNVWEWDNAASLPRLRGFAAGQHN